MSGRSCSAAWVDFFLRVHPQAAQGSPHGDAGGGQLQTLAVLCRGGVGVLAHGLSQFRLPVGEFAGGSVSARKGGERTGLAEALLQAADEGRGNGETLGHLGGGVALLAGLVNAHPKVVAEGSHSASSSFPLFYACPL
jgi:hypothetical protein